MSSSSFPWPCFHVESSQSQSYFTTDSQSATQSWYQATIWEPPSMFLSLPWKLSSDNWGFVILRLTLTRGRVYHLLLLLRRTSAVYLRDSCTYCHERKGRVINKGGFRIAYWIYSLRLQATKNYNRLKQFPRQH
jgi:hypothetical protein